MAKRRLQHSKVSDGQSSSFPSFLLRLFLSLLVLAILAMFRLTSMYMMSLKFAIPEEETGNIGRNAAPKISSRSSSTTTVQQQMSSDSFDTKPLLPEELTIIIPVYNSLDFLDSLMDTLETQTYPNLNLLFSIEPTEEASDTNQYLERYIQDQQKFGSSLIRNITIYNHQNRLYYFENMNFLLSKVESKYYSYMQCDDTLPANYYEMLVKCLESNLGAVNCYPKTMVRQNKTSVLFTESNEPSLLGPDYDRVFRFAVGFYYYANRGVVRRPLHGRLYSYPRLYKNFLSTDVAMLVKQAIAGEMIAVDVPYYKLSHDGSLSHDVYNNKLSDSELRDIAKGWVDYFVYSYNIGHSYTKNSTDFAHALENSLQSFSMLWLQSIDGVERIRFIKERVSVEFWKRIQKPKPKRVAVLGAGIQGTLMALMFRKHGYDVTIIDKSPNSNDNIMGRTSTTGVAHIHAGLEYSNDKSMKTARYMLNSAMRFSSYTEYLVGHSIDWTRLKSERITCLLPYSSHVSPTEFENFGDKLHNIYEEILAENPSLSYLGERPPKILIGKTEIPKAVNSSYINAAYESIEVCIHSKKLKEVIRNALYEHGVQIVFNRTIVDVKRTDPKDGLGKFEVRTDIGGGNRFDAVVNCLWEGRATIDRRLGLDHRSDSESYRVKANVRLDNLPQFHKDIPSVSIMNGPYGDFVRYGPDDKVYFAWHPMSPKLLTHNISQVISKFEGHAKSEFPPGYEDQIIDGHRKAFEMLFPGYDTSFFDNGIVGTGYVVANGLTDIDDPDSGFHERNDPPNLVVDGYVSVKTQKFTNAPYNVHLLEQELFEKDILLE